MTVGLGTSIVNLAGTDGLSFMASSGLVSCTVSGTGNFPLSIFNPNTNKNILIYSIAVAASNSSLAAMLASTTSDPAYPSALTPKCVKLNGGVPSIASVTWAPTSQSLPNNSAFFAALLAGGNTQAELLTNNQTYLLPAKSNNGLTTWIQAYSTGYILFSAKWIEY